jgi:hypothetical protein
MQDGQPTTDNRKQHMVSFSLSVVGFSLALSVGGLGALAVHGSFLTTDA